jgi:PAS domain S-box-containing protein
MKRLKMQAAIQPDPLTLELGSTFAEVSGNLMMTLLEQSQDCVKLLDTEGRLGFMNRNGRCSMEVDDFCAVAGLHWWDLWPDDAKGVVRRAVCDAIAGKDSRFEAFCPTAKGTPRWWDVTVSPVRDNAGTIFQLVSFSRDVTEQVKAREALEIMALEMRHRLRNAFTVSGAIAMVSAKEAPEHRAFAHDLANRYAALAQAQSQMLEKPDKALALADLLEIMTAPYALIDWHCPAELMIDDRNAKVIALGIGELATNSMKYGALSRNAAVMLDGASTDGALCLTWHESDVAPSEHSDEGGGNGHNLIDRIARVYGGTFAVDWAAEGLTATLRLPA